ncbi:hypothetical protein [Aquirufa sp.]|jgi:hypothetical protein|uniref:hypothetical protein n=1 Tax=Aquirufa sp. TaxID=2676249 RepID=UPI0037BFABB5
MKHIVIFGGNKDIVGLLVRLIGNYPEFTASGFQDAQKVLAPGIPMDVLLLSSGVSTADEALVRGRVSVPIIQHFGGGSGLLRAELQPYL